MQPDRNKTHSVEGEARRGAHNARAFLATNPTQANIWRAIQWTYDEEVFGDDDHASIAYDHAWRATLLPHLIDAEATRQEVKQVDMPRPWNAP